jgi:hypothetical protein
MVCEELPNDEGLGCYSRTDFNNSSTPGISFRWQCRPPIVFMNSTELRVVL